MTTLTDRERQQAGDLVRANHILAARNILDAFGHVSARSLDRPALFLLARNMAPALVRREDVHLFDQNGGCVTAADVRVYLERFLHAQIYAARTDIQAIVHSHSVSVIPFGLVRSCPLRPAYHMSAFIGAGVPIFDIADVKADSDMLITDNRLGACLAHELGAHNAILMRGHGVTVAGTDIPQAVFRAVYLELNASIQIAATALGAPRFLTEGEAAAAAAATEGQADRAWTLWVRQLGDAED